MTIPSKIAAALAHVHALLPEIVRVTYDADDDSPAGFWKYETIQGEVLAFPASVDVGLLEDALDEAWEAAPWPVTYSLPTD